MMPRSISSSSLNTGPPSPPSGIRKPDARELRIAERAEYASTPAGVNRGGQTELMGVRSQGVSSDAERTARGAPAGPERAVDVQFRGVTKRFGADVVAVDNVDLDV